MKVIAAFILSAMMFFPDGAQGATSRSAGETITTRRSIRRFTPQPVPRQELIRIAEAGSLASTPGNLQPWQFIILDTPELTNKLFPLLRWLAQPPPEKQRPTAYIALLMDKDSLNSWDRVAAAGAAFQNMQLYAWGKGIGSCCLGSVQRDKAALLLEIPDHLHLFVVIALGYPDETPVAKKADDSLRPYRDEDGVLHVPKKPIEDMVHFGAFGERE